MTTPAWTLQQSFDLALQYHRCGRLREAEGMYRQVLAQQPLHADALHLLGVLVGQQGQHERAVELIRQAIAVKPNYPEAFSNLGVALKDQDRFDEAIVAVRQALALKPAYAEAHRNLGALLRSKGQLQEALAACRQALALTPAFAEAHDALGTILYDLGDWAAARAAYEQALALQPTYGDAHYGLALLLLLQGDFPRGWKEHEWRWHCRHFTQPARNFTQPQWDGAALGHRTILLHAEQGMGDVIQFIRYAAWVAERGGKVLVECQPELRRLLQGTPGVAGWLSQGDPLPPFDVQCPLMSLPMVFGTTLQSIPQAIPYVQAEAPAVARWRNIVAKDGAELKVGLCWSGRPDHPNRTRAICLAALEPLAHVRGVQFYSLQKGLPAAQAKNPPAGMQLIDHTEQLTDYAETAALMMNLDLVISTCTSVVHLAGALGRPTWALLAAVPDWRWLLQRSDSPWYPTTRLFRQPSPGDWNTVTQQAGEALAALVGQRRIKA